MPICAERSRLGHGEPRWGSVRAQRTKTGTTPVESIHVSERVRRIKPSPSTSAADRANQLRREGRSIVNLVVGEPDFDTPALDPRGRRPRDGRRRHPLHDAGGHRRASAGDRRQARPRERHRVRHLRDRSDERREERDLRRLRRDARRRRRGDRAGALLGLLSRRRARLRRRAGAGRLPRGAGVQAGAGAARGCDHAADPLAGPQLALEPDRRDLHRRRIPRARQGACPPPPRHGDDRRHLRAHPLRERRRPAPPRRRARAARPDAGDQRRLQDLRDDRLAHRLGGRAEGADPRARHAALAGRRQRLLGQPGGRRRGAERRPVASSPRASPPTAPAATGPPRG